MTMAGFPTDWNAMLRFLIRARISGRPHVALVDRIAAALECCRERPRRHTLFHLHGFGAPVHQVRIDAGTRGLECILRREERLRVTAHPLNEPQQTLPERRHLR